MNALNADINGNIDFFPLPNRKLINPTTLIPELKGKYFITFRNANKKDSLRSATLPAPALISGYQLKGRISLRNKEILKKLQTFPSNFIILHEKQIINAVPPKFMEAIALKTMSNLKELGIEKQDYTAIFLFAGCGGSSLGYKWAGFKEILAIDFDRNAVETFKLNFPEIPIWEKDIKEIKGTDILNFCNIQKGELDVLDGSPPCQGFSMAGKRNVYDKRNDLVLEYIRLVDELQPKVFVMENVSGMIKGTMKGLFKEYMLKMKELNYEVKCKLMNAKYYNVPQSRERLIWIGIRKKSERK